MLKLDAIKSSVLNAKLCIHLFNQDDDAPAKAIIMAEKYLNSACESPSLKEREKVFEDALLVAGRYEYKDTWTLHLVAYAAAWALGSTIDSKYTSFDPPGIVEKYAAAALNQPAN